MFKVSLEEKKGLKFYQVTDTQTEEYVTILHEAGCALNNYVIMKKGIPIDLIDGYQDFNDLQENIDRFFKGHFLFPFPNRIYGGSYTFNGKKLQLKKNFPHEDNAIHGFLYNKEFSVLSFTESSNEGRVSFSREISGEFEGYPFKCKVLISFIVGRRKLNISTEIINTGEIEMPAGLGWHPYFQTGSKVSDLILEVPETEKWNQEHCSFSPVNFLNGKEPINGRRLDDCFRLNNSGNISLRDISKGIRINIEADKELPYFQVYIPPHGKSIAIEPMSCVPDSFNNKIGLKLLARNERWETSWSVKVSEIS